MCLLDNTNVFQIHSNHGFADPFYSLLLPLATIKSHQTRCGGISKSKELPLEQDVSCSIDVVYPMHTTKQSTTEIHRKAVQHHKKGYVEDRRSLYEIRRFQMPIQHCQCFGVEVTKTDPFLFTTVTSSYY